MSTFYRATVKRLAKIDSPYYRDRPEFGQEIPLDIDIVVHPLTTSATIGIIVINYPGYLGRIDGYENKYRKIAEFLHAHGVGAVIQMENDRFGGIDYQKSVCDDLVAVIEYAVQNSFSICGSALCQIYLMGFSAGASAIAAVCADYLEVTKVLLIAPSKDAGEEAVRNGLGMFTGEVSIVVGEMDKVVGREAGSFFLSLALRASSKRLRIVPNCDHQFRGRENGMIMSKAPLWAFDNDATFP